MTRMIVQVALMSAALAVAAACERTKSQNDPAAGQSADQSAGADKVTLPNGVQYQDLKVGDGAVANKGDTVNAHATGWLTDGTKFWSSHDGPGKPIDFALRNPGGVIQGWVDGVSGMKVGGKRKLWIPAQHAYGARGRPPAIPPNSDLVFEVELMAVR